MPRVPPSSIVRTNFFDRVRPSQQHQLVALADAAAGWVVLRLRILSGAVSDDRPVLCRKKELTKSTRKLEHPFKASFHSWR